VPEIEAALSDATTEPVAGEPLPHGRGSDDAVPETEVVLSEATIEAEVRAPDLTEPMRVPAAAAGVNLQAHWLLSLFTPAAEDTVDWGRGSYSVLARGGRIDSPSGSGELKKQIQMVAEGSVLYANGIPMGAAADVAPDGFAHPVFRSGFALAIPLPEVH
jgi:CRISPR/Cas system CSM-associated protein Csm4 (group 5 of RAMP superfamily)